MVSAPNCYFFFYLCVAPMVVVSMSMNHPKEGTKHFIQQRLTAVSNIILGIVVFNFFINNINRSYEDVINGLSNNLMWLIIIFFTFSMSFHMWIGLNHILDDYIDGVKLRSILGKLNLLVVIFVAFSTSALVIKISLL